MPQVIILFEEYEKLQEEKAAPVFDEDAYKIEIENIMRMFHVPIKEYV